MGRGGRRQDEGIVCELRRPGRAEAISLLRDLSKRDSSKARTERGTREPRQSRVLRSQTSPPPPLPTTSTCPAAAAAPEAARASCSLLVGAATRTGSFPGLPHGRPARPGGPSRSCLPPSLPPSYRRPRGSPPVPQSPPSPQARPSSASPFLRSRRERLPWASPPLVSTPMAFPVPDRFSKNFGW